MAVRRLAEEQPESFEFTPENLSWAEGQIAKFPEGRQASAIIPLMWRAQEQFGGWLPEPAIRYVADMLGMPYIRALEVATFYTMFQLHPVGKKAHVQVCGTTPCMLRGAGDLIKVCKSKIAARAHEISADGNFSWEEVECLGACVNAPMVQIFKDTYEDLTVDTFTKLLDDISAGRDVVPGPQNGRHFSVPEGGAVTLTEVANPGPLGGKPVPQVVDGSAKTINEVAGIAINSGPQPEPANDTELHPGGTTQKLAAKKSAAQTESPATPEAAGQKIGRPDADPRADEEAVRRGGSEKATNGQGGVAETIEKPSLDDPRRPQAATLAAGEKPDDLKLISGVGPVIEKKLHELGVVKFAQIAAWNDENIAWADGYLKFRGRIKRDNWVEQAKTLAAGGETEFSKRASKGGVYKDEA